MRQAASAAIISEAIKSLPEKVQRRCDLIQIQKWLTRFGCADDVEKLYAALTREDSRAAFKQHAPVVLAAHIQARLMPIPSDTDAAPPADSEMLLHEPIPEETIASATMRQGTRVATFPFTVPGQGQQRRRPAMLICGHPPARTDLNAMCPLYSCERALYPAAFLESIGLHRLLFCEQLSYGGQERRDVPDLDGGTLYIDVSDRALRRSRHAFHHELWHMADYKLRGKLFEQPDAEWEQHNPPTFAYGFGGKFMRTPGSADPPSAPSEHFLNAYSTSSIAEDKAEVWAALMCYRHALNSAPLRAKAALLEARAATLCAALDAHFWARVRWHQRALSKEWEPHGTREGKAAIWHSWVTGAIQRSRPESHADGADLCASLALAGLDRHAPTFEGEGYVDLAIVHSLSPEVQMDILGKVAGLTIEEALRLLAALDEFLLMHKSSVPKGAARGVSTNVAALDGDSVDDSQHPQPRQHSARRS